MQDGLATGLPGHPYSLMAATNPSVLLIDDDAKLARLLTEYLGGQGMSVTHAADGPRGIVACSKGTFDVVLLDLMLPGMDGLAVCQKLRQQERWIPIVMLTARGEETDRIVGLELGADDYLPKPFNPRELLARIRAVLRRTRPDLLGGETSQEAPVRVGDLLLDPRSRQVSRRGAEVRLTTYEFELLRLLMLDAGRVLSRERLLDRLKGEEFESFDRSIDVHISRLRQKLERNPKDPKLIKTIRGVGYLLASADEP
jgi:two-component system OmpR family response regulator